MAEAQKGWGNLFKMTWQLSEKARIGIQVCLTPEPKVSCGTVSRRCHFQQEVVKEAWLPEYLEWGEGVRKQAGASVPESLVRQAGEPFNLLRFLHRPCDMGSTSVLQVKRLRLRENTFLGAGVQILTSASFFPPPYCPGTRWQEPQA